MGGRGRGRGRGGGGGSNKVGFVKPAEPSFIRKLKEQHGYKEGPSLEDKMRLNADEDEDCDDDDKDGNENITTTVVGERLEDYSGEAPVVVVLKKGDLTKDEADLIQERLDKEEAEKPVDPNAKIVFKKPTKKREAKDDDKSSDGSVSEKKRKKDKQKKQLLSFGDDEEEEC